MSNPRITAINALRQGTLGYSTQDPAHPAINALVDSPSLAWRSRNGSGSGNGLFTITAASNDKIDFDEGGAELTATLTAGSYTGTSLATEVKTQMDAAGGTYTVSYSESTGKFTIARAAGNFTLRWQSGTNTAKTAGVTLGFNVAANDTGADTYTSDYARYHSQEYLTFDLGAASIYNSIAIINHNLSASATITLYGADDAAFTTNLVTDSLTYNAASLYEYLGTARTKRYVKLHISDPANSSGYVSVGTIFLGYYFDLDQDAQAQDTDGYDDPGLVDITDSGVPIALDRGRARVMSFFVQGLGAASYGNLMNLARYNGKTSPYIICFNYSAANANSFFVHNVGPVLLTRIGKNVWRWEAALREVV